MQNQFQPSQYSYLTLGDAGGAGATSGPRSVTVKDVPGSVFEVHSDGKITMGGRTISTPGAGNYDLMMANLADVPGNTEKIASVLGTTTTTASIEAGKVLQQSAPAQGAVAPSGKGGLEGPVGGEAKALWDQIWFWPVVILGSASVLGGAIYFFRSTTTGQKQFGKLKKAMG